MAIIFYNQPRNTFALKNSIGRKKEKEKQRKRKQLWAQMEGLWYTMTGWGDLHSPDAKDAVDVIPDGPAEHGSVYSTVHGDGVVGEAIGCLELLIQQLSTLRVEPLDQWVAMVFPGIILRNMERSGSVSRILGAWGWPEGRHLLQHSWDLHNASLHPRKSNPLLGLDLRSWGGCSLVMTSFLWSGSPELRTQLGLFTFRVSHFFHGILRERRCPNSDHTNYPFLLVCKAMLGLPWSFSGLESTFQGRRHGFHP